LTPVDGTPPPIINLIAYTPDTIEEVQIAKPDDVIPYLKPDQIVWIDVEGLGLTDTVEAFGRIFSLHPLALEDVLNVHHRAKTDDYEDYLFTILRMARMVDGALDLEQMSIFCGEGYVLTFQERPGDVLDPVRERIRKGKNRRIRQNGSDYLAYAILDAAIDGYYPVLEHYGETLNDLEDDVVASPNRKLLSRVHNVKRDLRLLRQALWPMREMVNNATRPYLRDCHDHVIQVLDILETYRERAGSMTDIYLSSVSNRMNEVMKVLTVISTIFIPLTFIVGVYGMNFDTQKSPWNMPELEWEYGYVAIWGVMLTIAAGLLFAFWRRGWLGSRNSE
jgi:magnesium transporter